MQFVVETTIYQLAGLDSSADWCWLNFNAIMHAKSKESSFILISI